MFVSYVKTEVYACQHKQKSMQVSYYVCQHKQKSAMCIAAICTQTLRSTHGTLPYLHTSCLVVRSCVCHMMVMQMCIYHIQCRYMHTYPVTWGEYLKCVVSHMLAILRL